MLGQVLGRARTEELDAVDELGVVLQSVEHLTRGQLPNDNFGVLASAGYELVAPAYVNLGDVVFVGVQ